MSFDRATGEQWIADVGQSAYEEVNVVAAGRAGVNYGWNRREGMHAYRGGERPEGAVDPVIETSHSEGACSITGGFVYRGTRIAGLAGRYLFSDYCDSKILAGRPDGNGWRVDTTSISGKGVRSFGEDASGELYVLDNDGLKRIDPA
jgi:glucose/arabinose dehydrogenase